MYCIILGNWDAIENEKIKKSPSMKRGKDELREEEESDNKWKGGGI